jgi:3-hydroxyacyl-CoA dehydrogenase
VAVEIKTIAVIGAGELGREIARAALAAGYQVVLEDVFDARLQQARGWIAQKAESGSVQNLSTAATVEDAIRDADLIVEATADEMEGKMELFTIFDKFAKPGAIFASASDLAVSEMSDLTVVRERCVGMRFGLPRAQALEVVKTALTSAETVSACVEVGRRMGVTVTTTREVGP